MLPDVCNIFLIRDPVIWLHLVISHSNKKRGDKKGTKLSKNRTKLISKLRKIKVKRMMLKKSYSCLFAKGSILSTIVPEDILTTWKYITR